MERVSAFAYHTFVVNCRGLTRLRRELARRKGKRVEKLLEKYSLDVEKVIKCLRGDVDGR